MAKYKTELEKDYNMSNENYQEGLRIVQLEYDIKCLQKSKRYYRKQFQKLTGLITNESHMKMMDRLDRINKKLVTKQEHLKILRKGEECRKTK